MQQDVIISTADQLIQEFDIRTPGPLVNSGSLSGGNQQKVIVARECSRPIKLLVASQPTRGLDVGSVEYIHRRILQRGTRAAPCCWSPPSWMRSCSFPTGLL